MIDGFGLTETHLTVARTLTLPDMNPECCHHNTGIIDHSLNRNLNDPPTALKSMFLTTDTLLTPIAQSLVPLIQPIPDAQMHGNHLKNLISHLPTTLHVQMHDH